MKTVAIFPGRYIQGQGMLREIGVHASKLGDKALVFGGNRAIETVKASLTESLKHSRVAFVIDQGIHACTMPEIARLTALCSTEGCNLVIGVGGGIVMDAAKVVAERSKCPLINVPTVASTDAPCSGVAAIYTEDGSFEQARRCYKNPDVVLVDTAVITQAPVRLFVAGMGDALATWFEADACARAGRSNLTERDLEGLSDPYPTSTGRMIAKLAFDLLMQYGEQAKEAVELGICTEAVERVVEANTLCSGTGFENGGLAIAHAVQRGLSLLDGAGSMYHGERVGFGVLTQIVAENRPKDELAQVFGFCAKIGLPVTFTDLCQTDTSRATLMRAAEQVAHAPIAHNVWFPVDAELICDAMSAVDAMGKRYRQTSLAPSE
jgi:glycerol dehydrogenase